VTGTSAGAVLEALAGHGVIEMRAMIVVAHPDDETIGMGAQLCRFHDALLVQITDGAPRDGRDAVAHGFATTTDYAGARSRELRCALEAGDAHGITIEAIGITDQEACLELVSLAERLAARLHGYRPEAIFVQPYEGGHPDHDAGSFAARAACRLIEAAGKPSPAVIEMTAYHAQGAGLATGTFLPGLQPVISLTLSIEAREQKRRMIDCFASQRELLAPFGIEVEQFREAPGYDFARPPHPGELHYERLGWGITGALWRRQAQAALAALGLATSG
jgi:LmbE family N-acetylglucosaminyl deacetylase